MPARRPLWSALGALLAAVAAVGCSTSTAQMTPQQREGVELRRYCEQNPEDEVRCVGFLGFR
jgi:hypothetical protein